MILDETASSDRDWAPKPASLISRRFIHAIVPRADAVAVYWMRPGREPSKDWTRTQAPASQDTVMADVAPSGVPNDLDTAGLPKVFWGSCEPRQVEPALSAAGQRLIQMGDWRVFGTTPRKRKRGRASHGRDRCREKDKTQSGKEEDPLKREESATSFTREPKLFAQNDAKPTRNANATVLPLDT